MPDLVIGQYYGADSPVHRADPRFKVLLAFIYMVEIFIAPGFPGLAVMAFFTLILIKVSKVPLKVVAKSVSPLLFILVFAVLINLFFTTGGNIYWHWGIFTIGSEGLYKAGFYPARMVLLLFGMSLLTLTTSSMDLTDSAERLMKPLKRTGFPVHEFAMMLSIALRFLPVFADEFVKIRRAQESRAADFSSGNIFRRAKALLPIMVPLFVSAFRHAENLATAMESRCYHGGDGRTRMRIMTIEKNDYLALLLFFLIFVALIVMRLLW